MQISNNLLDVGNALALSLGQRFDVSLISGHELMQRRIQEADADGLAAKSLEQAFKVSLLHGLDLGQSGFALFHGLSADHFTESADTVGIEEHMLGTAQTDALSAESSSLTGVLGSIGIGTDGHGLILVRQLHDTAEVAAVGIGGHGGDQFTVNVAGAAIQRHNIAFTIGLTGQGEALVLFVHLDIAATRDAAGTHAAGHNSRMAGLTTANGEDTLAVLHAFDIFGAGLETYQNDLFALLAMFHSIFSSEDDMASGGAGAGSDTLTDGLGSLQGLGVKGGMQQHIQTLGVNLHQRFFFADHAFVDQVTGNLDGGLRSALAAAALQHEELAVFDGELHVLHVAVMVLQNAADFYELLISIGEQLFHLGDGHGRTNASYYVFALGIGQEFTHQNLFAGSGVTGEGHAGAAVVVQVAEYHGHYVNGSTPAVGDVMVHAVYVGTGVVPAAEYSADSFIQLHLGIRREVSAQLLLVLGFELLSQLAQIGGGQFGIKGDALLFLHGVDQLLEILLADFHYDVREHLDETAIAVINKALELRIGVALDHRGNDVIVQAQVQDGIHHARHGGAGTGADGDQQRVGQIAELLAVDLLHLFDVGHDFGHDLVIDLTAIFVVLGAGFGRDGEALGHGQADVGHFSQVGAFAAQQLAHLGVAFGEQVHVLLHDIPPLEN